MRIDITLSPETVEKVRRASFEKYGNMRSTSRLIEELILKGLESEIASVGGEIARPAGNLPVDPVILRGAVKNAWMAVKEGKKIAVQTAAGDFVKGDLAAMIGITPVRKRIMIELPCFTPDHLEALLAKDGEITDGLVNESLRSKAWCANCEDYYRVPSLGNRYMLREEIEKLGLEYVWDEDEKKEAPSCDINYGTHIAPI